MKNLISEGLNGMEVGIEIGRFAIPLGIRVGVEAADNMVRAAKEQPPLPADQWVL